MVQTYTYTLYYSNLSLLAFWGLVLYPDFPEVEPSYPGKKILVPYCNKNYLRSLAPFWVYPIMRYTKIC